MLHRMTAGAIVVLGVISAASPVLIAQDNLQSIDAATTRPQVEIDLDAEVAAARKVDVASTEVNVRSLASLVQTARKCERFDRQEDATDLYHLSATLCESLLARKDDGLPPAQSVAIFATAASALTNQGRHADAERWLTLAITQDPAGPMISRLGQTYLEVASGYLDAGQLSESKDAYRSAAETLSRSDGVDPASLGTARLGLAWTMVMLSGSSGDDVGEIESTREALAATEAFLEHHPEHADASSAWLLKLSCQTRLGDTEGVSQTQSIILSNYPRSQATCEVLKSSCHWQNGIDALDQSLRQYLILNHRFVIESPVVGNNIHVLATGLLAAAVEGHSEAETGYALVLSISDEIGDASTYVLEHLHAAGHDAAASRIAIGWISARDAKGHQSELAQMQEQAGRLITVGVREAACRWAGRTGRWSVLAMAAEEENVLFQESDPLPADPTTDEGTTPHEADRRGLSLHVKRLFAEGLLQSGKTKESLQLWEHIVDHGGADDFPTLLRTAETAVAAGSVAQATMRIAAARGAAGQSSDTPAQNQAGGGASGRYALTNLLAANLEIRQLRFDRGRALLEQVVRSAEATNDLRGRAQWMIGETFFMQQKFTEAIAAYRQVEPIGRSDEWTAAALVQAGKSFEQLGRTREATVCYSTLVSRFGESPHASGARRRLAAMTTTDPESNTMRR
ncbi:tetratricopeptide repeat protein [Neorhodopirellula pilleata]|uniref:Tetratricopeptide repeat protein n=1 Tax=Neorhodopirellula pilleata TaxID=2714738 RepID=A0A5C6AQB0_9BACT|nr:tetratricopeptide repeat protein [Neorhodopirellula pilleata]TWU01667.1 Tetratricopeptide repeat protein [Neorhodopirellula pilleata]